MLSSQSTLHGKHVDTVSASINPGNALHMARYVQNATRLVTSGVSAGVKGAEQYMK